MEMDERAGMPGVTSKNVSLIAPPLKENPRTFNAGSMLKEITLLLRDEKNQVPRDSAERDGKLGLEAGEENIEEEDSFVRCNQKGIVATLMGSAPMAHEGGSPFDLHAGKENLWRPKALFQVMDPKRNLDASCVAETPFSGTVSPTTSAARVKSILRASVQGG